MGYMTTVLNHYPDANTTGKTFDDWVTELNALRDGRVFFVEIGAMDGVRHDALYKHIVAHPHWSGLLVEPLPDMFGKLKAAYSGRDTLAFENVAITETDGTTDISRIPSDKVGTAAPEWADGISTLKPGEHILGQDSNLSQYAVTETKQTMTFASLAAKHNLKHIVIFQSDTEGYDKVIFDQVWQAGFRPSIIKLEINYMYYHVIRSPYYQLTAAGYQRFYQDDDIVAVQL